MIKRHRKRRLSGSVRVHHEQFLEFSLALSCRYPDEGVNRRRLGIGSFCMVFPTLSMDIDTL